MSDPEREFWFIVWRALLMICKALDKRWRFTGETKA